MAAITAIMASTMASGALAPAHAATAGMGPISTDNGYPEWYSDGNGTQLELCLTGPGCVAQPPDGGVLSFPDNFPEEAFWFLAEAGDATSPQMYRAALEAAFVNPGPAVPGDQMGFARIRFRINGLKPPVGDVATSYRITHPYGVKTLEADGAGIINETFDEGCAGAPCNFASVGAAFLSDFAGVTVNFLKQDGALPGTLGDLLEPKTVTGSPSGNNFVKVEELDAAGLVVAVVANEDKFTVQGQISNAVPGAPSTPNLDALSDSGRSSTDNTTNDTTPTVSGNSPAGSSVEILVDGSVATTTTATAAGSYSATLAALTPGTHTVQARTAGLASGNLTFSVDTTAPAVSVTGPFPSNPTTSNSPSLSFTGEAGATYECQLLPNNAAFTTCSSPKNYSGELDGVHTFNVRGTDVAGNVSAAATHSWRIGAAMPTVTTRSPLANATVVSQTANLTATLSENVNGVSGTTFTLRNTTTGAAVPAAVTYAAPGVATLDPTATLAAATRYTATLSSGIRDVANNAITASSWTFATGPRPTLTRRSPAVNATSVSQLGNLGAAFNRPVTGANGTSVTLTKASNGARIAAAVSYNTATLVATINPVATLSPATRYTVSLGSGIKDAVGNALTATAWSFSTGPRPTVTKVSPAANVVGVSRTANVAARFSESIRGLSRSTVILRKIGTTTNISAVVTYNAATRTATLNPSVTLAGNTRYTATLSSLIYDADGNRITSKSWRFTTRR